MYKKIDNKVFSLLILLVLAVVTVVYLPLLGSFFQQDEWIAFGNALSFGDTFFTQTLISAFSPSIGHYVPFHHLFLGIVFKLVGISFTKWMAISIFWHLITTYLVGILLFRLFKDKKIAILGMLMFGLSATAHQATSWAVADINTHGSTFFGILSILLIDRALKNLGKNSFLVYLSVLSVFVSLMFKETTIGLFAVIPAYYFINGQFNSFRSFLYKTKIWYISGAFYFFVRFIMLLLPSAHNNNASLVTATQSLKLIIYNILSSPAKALTQSLIPQSLWLNFAQKLTSPIAGLFGLEPNTTQFDHFVQARVLEIIFLAIFVFVCSSFFYFIKKFYKNYYLRLILFSLIFISFCSFVYALSPERTGIITFLDSRNLYFLVPGVLILTFSLLKLAEVNSVIKYLGYFLVFAVLALNTVDLRTTVLSLSRIGEIRRQFLTQFNVYVPQNRKKVVFYVDSDTSYYGLPETTHIPPFQSGFGQTLLVWYTQTYPFPPDFYKNYFLWPIQSQEYKEIDGYGFGYFREYDKLLSAVITNKIDISSVYSMKWVSTPQALINITQEIQSKLKNEINNSN